MRDESSNEKSAIAMHHVAEMPIDEAERLEALRRTMLVGTEPEERFDRIAKLAARLFDAPIALISLVDENRQWLKARCGVDIAETERDVAFCAHTILNDHNFVVPDAAADPRFASNPYVIGAPGIRFYAGAPLTTRDGLKLGALCIIDTKPRPSFSEADRATLTELAATVVDMIEASAFESNLHDQIEQRHEAEADLKASEARFRGTFDVSPIGVALVAPSGAFTRVNQALCEIVGYTEQELLAADFQTLTHPEDLDADLELVKSVLAGERTSYQMEKRYIRKDGKHIWILLSVSLVRDEAGEPLHFVSQIIDISDRKLALSELGSRMKAEERLASFEKHLALLNAHNPVAMAMLNRDMQYIDANERWRDLMNIGCSEEISGRRINELSPHLPALWTSYIERALLGDVIDPPDDKLPLADGSSIWARRRVHPSYDKFGAIDGVVISLESIEESYLARTELEQGRAFKRAILENIQDGIIACNEEGRITHINAAARSFLSLDPKAPIGELDLTITRLAEQYGICDTNGFTPLAIDRNPMFRALSGEIVRSQEITISVPGQQIRRLVVQAAPNNVEDSRHKGAVASLHDVTQERIAQERWREASARYRAIFDHTFQFCGMLDTNGILIEVNETAVNFAGVPRTELIGRPFWETHWWQVGEDTKLRLIEAFNKAREGAFVRYEVEVNGADGAKAPIDFSLKPVQDEMGRITSLIAEGRDISDKKASERALKSSEERYRSFYNNAPVMLLSLSPDGELLSVSDYWLSKTGYERAEVEGRDISAFLSGEEDALDNLKTASELTDAEIGIQTKNGEHLHVLMSAVMERDAHDEYTRILCVLTDITERRNIENQLMQSQKMESVGQLTGGLAHDFNNILGVLLGNLQLMEPALQGDEKSTHRMEAALRAVDRASELTQRLLAFSRRQKLEFQSLDPNPHIDSLMSILQRTLGEAIEIKASLQDGLPPIRTDSAQLESAILNLAVNARDAMPEGGSLTIESELCVLDEDASAANDDVPPGSYVVIAITDNGDGIPADKLARVFEPFYTTKDVGKGSGLGLSMVYGFMKQSGGQIRIYSEENVGTTVRLYFPLIDDENAVEPAAVTEIRTHLVHESTGSETILVVEDQAEVRDVAVALLNGLGYHTVEAANAEEALATLQKRADIDLIFTDTVMPGGMDGVQLAEKARETWPDLPVVFTTGFAEAAILQRGDIKTASNLVTKPYRRAELSQKISNALSVAGLVQAEPAEQGA